MKSVYARCALMLRLLSVGLSTTGGTGELNGADNSVLGVHQFETVEVEFADLESLAEAEVVNVDNHTFGDFSVDSFHADFLHREVELTTGFHTFCVAFELNGNFDGDGLLVSHFEEVHVKDGVFNRVELDVLEDSHASFAVYSKLDSEDIGSVDEFADCVLSLYDASGHEALAIPDLHKLFAGFQSLLIGEVNDFAAVENHGDLVFFAEGFGSLFAEVCTGLGCQLKCLHF